MPEGRVAVPVRGENRARPRHRLRKPTTIVRLSSSYRTSRDLLISNQVAKGFELLGNKDNQIQQRLGGIYALEGVMNTSKDYHQPVLESAEHIRT